jgi:L-iditol 2-dehydrogenase
MESLAARYFGVNQMHLETVEIAAPQSRELVIRVRRTGVCATDLRIFQAGSSAVKPPVTLGHEISGEIAEVGDNVSEFEIGDKVCVVPDIYCGQCVQCYSGSENICENVSTLGYSLDGGYSEYLRLPGVFLDKHLVYKLPEQMSLEDGALVEPLACCYHGLQRARVDSEKTVLVVGDGPIGMMHLILAKLFGSRAGMSGLVDRNLRLAETLGADFTVDASTDPTRKVKEETERRGADVVIVAVSSPSVIEQAMSFVSKRGSAIIFGGCTPGSKISVDPNQIHYGEVTLSGSASYTYADYQNCFEIVARHRVKLDPIITNRYPLEQIDAAFDAEIKGQTIKTMIVQ